MSRDGHLLVYCTCPDQATARRLARDLVEQSLAACVSELEVGSTYEWEGKLEQAEERLLMIKTRPDAFARLQQRIVALHPYELPEIIAVSISDGLPAYLEWISGCVRSA